MITIQQLNLCVRPEPRKGFVATVRPEPDGLAGFGVSMDDPWAAAADGIAHYREQVKTWGPMLAVAEEMGRACAQVLHRRYAKYLPHQ